MFIFFNPLEKKKMIDVRKGMAEKVRGKGSGVHRERLALDTRLTVTGMKAENVGASAGSVGGGGCE